MKEEAKRKEKEERERKVKNIEATGAALVATGNIGCITQIASASSLPIVHTVELLDWAYGGKRNAMDDPQFRLMALPRHVTADFPPAFISAGNGDPLLGQSERMADSLRAAGAPVETLFFPADRTPALGHEYQFDLDSAAGKQAFERMVAFARRVSEKKAGTSP